MSTGARKRDFLTLTDLTLTEAEKVLAISAVLKRSPKNAFVSLLAGRSVAVVLEKSSTRTRVSFEVGCAQLGAHPVVLGLEGSQLGRGEPIRDTARVLARYCDAIAYRTAAHSRLVEMATGSIPVINALSDDGHPVQVLCDLFTVQEAFARAGDMRPLRERKISFVGDGASNMARSWVEAAGMFGFELVVGAPKGYQPPAEEVARAKGKVTVTDDPRAAVVGADVVNTDVWTSMGQEAETRTRLQHFAGWMVDEARMSGAAKNAIVLHCLPAHRGEEIDDATLEGSQSRVWDQAENRLHVQKGLLCWLLGVGDQVLAANPA